MFTPALMEATPENIQKWEKRAPSWRLRCWHCSFDEPFGKYGIRKHAAGTKRMFACCPQCKKWTCMIIDRK